MPSKGAIPFLFCEEEMGNNPFYFNLTDDKKESALGFLLESVLKSRIQLGLEDPPAHSDEDVNMYLAFLLLEAGQPSYLEKISHLTSPRNSDIFRMIEDSQDNYFKYLVYKTNADYLLLLLSIFQNLNREGKGEGAFFDKSQSAYEGYAKTYYQFACEYNRLVYRKVTAIGIILNKLSHSFDRYEQILVHVREAYLKFLKTQEQEFSKFLKDLEAYKRELHLRERKDLFLDLYSLYLKTKDAALQRKLLDLGHELERLDPSFKTPLL